MMPREKTSKAVIKSARFNPETSEEDREVLAMIDQMEKEHKLNFKQIVSAALLELGHFEPEMFARNTPPQSQLISQMHDLFASFAEEIIQKIEETGVRIRPDNEAAGTIEKPSPFARNFANGFAQRQKQVLGNEEDE